MKATVGGTDGGGVDATVGSTVHGSVSESESQCESEAYGETERESKREDLPVIVERLFAALRSSLEVEHRPCGDEALPGGASASRYGAEPRKWDEVRWREYTRDWGVSAMLALVGGSLLELVGEVVPLPEAVSMPETAPTPTATLVPVPETAPTSTLTASSEARPQGDVPPSAHRVVRDIEDIIAREAASDLTVTTIAKRVFVSANYASRLYKQSTGRTITEAMILARVERAKELLAERSPIKAFQVGELVGYPDPVYFTKLFKRCVGMTPKQYREMNLTSPNADKKLG